MEITVKTKFDIEDTVWFMHENNVKQGVITEVKVEYNKKLGWVSGNCILRIFNKLESYIHTKEENLRIRYQLDRIEGTHTASNCLWYDESILYHTKQELLDTL